MHKFELAHYITLAMGITLGDAEIILSIICLLLSIIFGVVSVVLKFKHYNSDGKIDQDELKDLLNDINDIKDKLDNK